MTANKVKADLQKLVRKDKAKHLPRFFKTGKDEYGEGDKFIGVVVPDQRSVAKKYKDLPLSEIQKLLDSSIHEHRLTALLILTYKLPKASEKEKEQIAKFYLRNTKAVNNWDLVDLSAPRILGGYLLNKDRKILYKFANSKDLWKKRIAVLSTFAFIYNNDFDDSLKIADVLIQDNHDLIHKAVGWMLREIGKRNQKVEEKFLDKHYITMPRTMLRYAIERFDKKKYDHYMGRG